MKYRGAGGLLQAISFVAALLLLAMPTASQNGTNTADPAGKPTPRTADGHPDLTGFWNNPPAPGGTQSFQKASDGSILFDFATNFNDNRLCVGLDQSCQSANQPVYKPEYMDKVKQIASTMHEGTTPLDPMTQCKPMGIPRSGGPVEIVQTPKEIVLLYEAIPYSTYRVIHMDSPHPEDFDTTYLGDSRGHWEGDTLVVDVTGLNDETWLGGDVRGLVKFTSIHSDKEHVVERWIRKGDTLTYEATVEDPIMFTKPWTPAPRKMQIADPDDTLLETVCNPQDASHFTKPTREDTGCNYRCSDPTKSK